MNVVDKEKLKVLPRVLLYCVLMIIIWPVGAFFMMRDKQIEKQLRVIETTCCFGLWILFVVFGLGKINETMIEKDSDVEQSKYILAESPEPAVVSLETNTPNVKPEEGITLVKIEAEYFGEDEAGVVLGSDLDDIDVTCIYSDGSTKEIDDGFNVKKTATLKPNKTSSITITYEGKECKIKVKCSTKKEHRKGKDIVGISNKGIYDIDGTFQANKVRNDETGNWRISTIAASVKMQKYALSYYKAKFRDDKEIHGIVNFNYNTTTKISVMGNMLDVTVHEYVKGEEHDANLLFNGMLLEEYHVYLDNGDIEKIK